MESKADKYLAKQDEVLLHAVARVWKAQERGRLLTRVKNARLLKDAWSLWKQKLQAQRQRESWSFHRDAELFSNSLSSSGPRILKAQSLPRPLHCPSALASSIPHTRKQWQTSHKISFFSTAVPHTICLADQTPREVPDGKASPRSRKATCD